MKTLSSCLTRFGLLVLPLGLPAAEPEKAANAFPLNAYSQIGSSLAESSRITRLGWTDAQFEAFVDGLRAAFHGQPYPLDAQGQALHEAIARQLQQLEQPAAPAPAAARAGRFSDPAMAEKYMKDVVKGMHMQQTDSGLAYLLISQGVGSRPAPEDTVIISYSATAPDGHTDYASLTAERRKVKVADLLPGLAEGVQLLVVGAQGMFVLPPDLSFGKGDWPAEVERGSPIIFTVTLHEVVAAP